MAARALCTGLFLLLVPGWSTSITADDGDVVVAVKDSGLYGALTVALHDRGVFVDRLSGKRLPIPAADVSYARGIIADTVEGHLGENAATFPPRQFEAVREAFDNAGLSYQVRCYASTQWLTWEEPHAGRAEELIHETTGRSARGNTAPKACRS